MSNEERYIIDSPIDFFPNSEINVIMLILCTHLQSILTAICFIIIYLS